MTSKSPCPMSCSSSKNPVRAKWGNSSRRKGKRSKCGSWCRICVNVWKLRFKKKWNVSLKGLKIRLNDKTSSDADLWAKARLEYIHRKKGGSSRVRDVKSTVHHREESQVKLVDPKKEFWQLGEYRANFGDPAKNKAKIKSMKTRGGKTVKGVVVQVGRKGVYALEGSFISSAVEDEIVESGELVLDP